MATVSGPSTFVCAFKTITEAQSAIHDLVNAGIAREQISLVAGDEKGEYASLPNTSDVKKTTDGTSVGQNVAVGTGVGALGGLLLGMGALAIPGIGPIVAAGPLAAALGGAVSGAAGGGLIGVLKDAGVPDEDAAFYGESIRKGGAIVTVHGDASQEESIDRILSRHNVVEVGERDHEGAPVGRANVGHTAVTPTPSSVTSGSRQPPARTGDAQEQVIPVLEETLSVGKRQVQGGSVRVYTRMLNVPVQENVMLLEEQIVVERIPVNRPMNPADVAALRNEVFEMTARVEEAVVSKEARVVEEILVGKDSSERSETIRDTVRRTDVRVEDAEGMHYSGHDADFRGDFTTRFGREQGAVYETYAPAYRYGYRMAGSPQYQGKSWNEVESSLQTDYLRENPGSTWDKFQGAVRYGWQKVSGQR